VRRRRSHPTRGRPRAEGRPAASAARKAWWSASPWSAQAGRTWPGPRRRPAASRSWAGPAPTSSRWRSRPDGVPPWTPSGPSGPPRPAAAPDHLGPSGPSARDPGPSQPRWRIASCDRRPAPIALVARAR